MKTLSLKEMIETTGAMNGLNYDKIMVQKRARVGIKNERITTSIDGEKETTQTLEEGMTVITGLAGEEYAVKTEKFDKLYQHVEGDLYMTKPDIVQAVEVKVDMKFLAPWGEEMIAHPGDFIIFRSMDDAYRVEAGEFKKTYELQEA